MKNPAHRRGFLLPVRYCFLQVYDVSSCLDGKIFSFEECAVFLFFHGVLHGQEKLALPLISLRLFGNAGVVQNDVHPEYGNNHREKVT